jgi:deoxyribose-phosphate aldolase
VATTARFRHEPTPLGPAPVVAPAAVPDLPDTDAALRRVLHGLAPVDAMGTDARAERLAARAVKGPAKAAGLDLILRLIDLTTLEGRDTPRSVAALCARARRPDPDDAAAPPVAAVCVYPDLVPAARAALAGSGVRVASVATAFPSGRAGMAVKLADTAAAIADGADEIDMVIDRGAFLRGRYLQVAEEIRAVRDVCGPTHLKVILETGELGSYDSVRRAAWLAMLAGADFVKTSTGKIAPAATRPVALVLLDAVVDFERLHGRRVGVKVAGGIRTAKDALRYLVLVHETDPGRLDPMTFRFGASSLLDDILMQRQRLRTGHYTGPDHLAAG